MSKQSDKLSKLYADIERHAQRVAAYVVMRGPEHVGTVRVHYPADGAGRLVVYVADWTLGRTAHVVGMTWLFTGVLYGGWRTSWFRKPIQFAKLDA